MLEFATRLGNRKRFSASQSWLRYQKAETLLTLPCRKVYSLFQGLDI